MRTWMLGLLMAVALFVVTGGCGDDEDAVGGGIDEAVVEQVVRDVVHAWNGGDVDALVALFTDDGLASAFGEGKAPRDEIVATLPEFVGDPPLVIRELEVDVSGGEATVETLWEAGGALEKVEFGLVEEGGTWKVNKQQDLAVELPDGAEPVTIQMNEFAFAFVAADIKTETIAFKGENVGEQDHEMALARIPADADVQELLRTEEDVPGFEFIGGAGPAAPGESISIVLAEGLTPGRYLMVCFLPDTDDPEETPHAFKGMTAEFTLSAQ